ncbi:Uncharacterised protein [Kluyvera cryocrescens]|uniref:Uncharacterized protein n=1 Tax=Kluyvera cryocrescens TaxID=580 RepID=A0A485C2X5_KLUCR|nr:Uncharacterised protein [Kluyvera cryocrescens]
MTHAVAFNTAVVLQYQQAFHFQVPHWVEQGGRTTAHAALRAGFHRGLEVFIERDTAGVEGFTAANWATQRTDAAGVDTDTGALGNIFHNRAGGGVDRVEAVAALDQYAGAELASRRTHAGHNWRRQRNFERGDRIVEAFYVAQTSFTWIVREQARGNQNVEELGALVDFTGDAVLHQVFTFQLLHGSVGEGHVTFVNDERVHLLELFFRIVFQQMIVVFTQIDHAFDMGEQCRWLELAVGFFAQVEYRQACSPGTGNPERRERSGLRRP